MFGRFNEVDDKPGWREKLAEFRDSPPIVFERPEWLGEGPGVLAMLFAGIGCAMLAIVYLAIPPATLPASVPGHFTAARVKSTTTTASTSTTTTTLSKAKKTKYANTIKGYTPDQKKAFTAWVAAAEKYQRDQAATDLLLSQPIRPPVRRWAYAFVAAVLAAILLFAAWFTSETRSRKLWAH
jgi:predicted transcriptional regulator